MIKIKKMHYLFLVLPFLDLITALITRNFEFSISPGIVIKGLFIIYLTLFIFLSKSKYKKISLMFLCGCFIYNLFYFLTKPELLSSIYIFNEIIYIFKLLYFPLVFLGLLCFYDEYHFDSKKVVQMLGITLLIYTIMLLFPLILGSSYNTYFELLEGKIGWFYSGNEISNIVVLLLASSFYFVEFSKKYTLLFFIPILFTIFQIGTKVSFLGTLIVILILLIFSGINSFHNKNKNFIKYIFLVLITLFYSSSSVTVQNYKYLSEKNISETILKEPIIIDEVNKEEVEMIQETITNFYDKNQFNKILKRLLSSRDIYLANTLSIYNNDLSNNNIWFGIGFSNTEKVNNQNIAKLIEIDILDGFFHYGILGLLIMLSPFLIIIYLIFLSNKKVSLLSLFYILIILLTIGISCLSGHVFTAPAVSIYLVFYLLLLLNEFKCIGRNKELKNKISILSLHMGYGGIERSIVNQANMLSQNYRVEIISLYKLSFEIPYQLNKNVKLIYLSDLKPNKEEFLKYFHFKNILKIISEGLKSIKILYFKKKLIGDYIYNSDSKIIISTRLEFTKLLNKYYNANCIRIAEEHVYHHNNVKYINKLKKALKNINYLIPASKYLTKDYKNYLKELKIKIIYIPQAVDNFPKKINKFINKNIIYVGRLEPEKGLLDLIEIFKLINKQNKDIKLTIVGDGSQKNNIDKMIKKYNLNKYIKVSGYLSGKNLIKEYKKASLFMLTSFEESFGLVLLEAMSYGIPCIAFDSALGAKEIINGKNGIIIKKRNKEIMSQEIINYFKNESYQKMIKEARNTAELYSLEQTKIKWEEFISKFINNK